MMKLFADDAVPYLAEPRGRGWYVADISGHDMLRVTYTSKRAAVRAIRLLAPTPDRTQTQDESKKAAIV